MRTPKHIALAEQKFRPLKKSMQKHFKHLEQALQIDQLPDRATVDAFLREAELMISYPGFGDDFYDAFLSACQRLSACYMNKDRDLFRQQLAAIKTLRTNCHERFRYLEASEAL